MFKKILFIIIAVVVVIFSIVAEDQIEQNQKTEIMSIIEFPEDTQFVIRTDQDRNWHIRRPGEIPRYIRAEEETEIAISNQLTITLSPQTVLKLVSLNQDLVHLRIISGNISYDNRVPVPQLIFLQTDQAAFEPAPFSRGTVSFSTGNSVRLEQEEGTKIITLFGAAEQKRELLLPSFATVEFRESDLTEAALNLNPYDLYSVLNLQEESKPTVDNFPVTTVSEVLQILESENTTNPIPTFLEKYVLTNRKQIVLHKASILADLQKAINQLRVNQFTTADQTLQGVNEQLRELERISTSSYQEHIDTLVKVFGGVPSQNRLFTIKESLLNEATLTAQSEAETRLLAQAGLSSPETLNQTIAQEVNFAIGQDDPVNQVLINHNGLRQLLKTPELITSDTLARLYSLHTQMLRLWPEQESQLYTKFTEELVVILRTVTESSNLEQRTKNQITQQAIETLELYHNNSTIPQRFQDYLQEQLAL
jgi:hypothetical protein